MTIREQLTTPLDRAPETTARDPDTVPAAETAPPRGYRQDHPADAQRERFGGFDRVASFFGWLVALGVGALLTGIIAAAGAAVGLTEGAAGDVESIGIAGGALLAVALALAYYAGGYVAGRMARFDGARQGFGVWVTAILATIALAVAGAILGSEYNVLSRLDLPRIPIDEGSLTTGAAIALAVVLAITLIAAVAGGKSGERYHRRIDELAPRA